MMIATVVMIFFVILPQLARVTGLREQIAQGRQHVKIIAARISEIESARAELQKAANEKDVFAMLFPAREEMAVSVEALEAAVAAAGAELELQLTDFFENPSKGRDAKPPAPLVTGLTGLEEVPFSAEITASFSGLFNFLRNLENSQVLVKFGALAAVAEQRSATETEPTRNTGQARTLLDGVFFIKKP